MHILHNPPTQAIKPMFLRHVLDFEKTEEVFEGLIIDMG
jgi:hypothetical protein